MARFDEALEEENSDLKVIIREELARRSSYLKMYDGIDEQLVGNTLRYLSGSEDAYVTRPVERILATVTPTRRERGQLAVICEIFAELSTHVHQDRLAAVLARLEHFRSLGLMEDVAHQTAPA